MQLARTKTLEGKGWMATGEVKKGLAALRDGLAQAQRLPSARAQAMLATSLGEALWVAGMEAEAHGVLADAARMARRVGDGNTAARAEAVLASAAA